MDEDACDPPLRARPEINGAIVPRPSGPMHARMHAGRRVRNGGAIRLMRADDDVIASLVEIGSRREMPQTWTASMKGDAPPVFQERMDSPLENRKIRLRGLWPRVRGAANGAEMADGRFLSRAQVYARGGWDQRGAPSE